MRAVYETVTFVDAFLQDDRVEGFSENREYLEGSTKGYRYCIAVIFMTTVFFRTTAHVCADRALLFYT